MTAEHDRSKKHASKKVPWKKWGPYLSERQWGTVREDYSEGGDAWDYFSHDQARSRAYRWGEDGLAGISDDQQRLCFALALWNGKDPILKERLFGLTNSESNHGEDVKEYYFYLDSTPTHSYMKYLYKYPQAAFPYADLVETSRSRSRNEFEYELLDTGVFDEDRYFDVFVEYAKESPEDILIQITRSQPRPGAGRAARPADALVPQPVVLAGEHRTGRRLQQVAGAAGHERRQGGRCQAGRAVPLLRRRRAAAVHRERNQHAADLRRRQPQPYVKDGINNYVVHGQAGGGESGADGHQGRGALSPDRRRRANAQVDSAAADRRRAGRIRRRQRQGGRPVRQPVRRRACRRGARRPTSSTRPSLPRRSSADEANVMRQALAGMLWSKQFYHYDVDKWLEERGSDPFKATRKAGAAQRPLAPHVQRRRHLHAGQVGVSLVRGLGPGLPRPRPDARRSRLRQAAAQADAARALHAPQRPDSGLRVELRRRQPAGACLGHDLHLPPGKGAEGRGRQGMAQELLSEAAAELHLVGQPQGPLRAERVRGRLPGPGQHRRVRSQRAAADRRLPGAGRRHRLDGPLLPEHAGDRHRAGA